MAPVRGSIVATRATGCAACHIRAVTHGTLTALAVVCAGLQCLPGDLLSFEP
jgi:hypothetical protein